MVVVVVPEALVEGELLIELDELESLPLVVPPEAPMELVLPGTDVLLLEGDVSVLGAGVVELEEFDEVVGVGLSVRFVQAPSETAATSARAAHEVRDAFIRKLLEGGCSKLARAASSALKAL